MAKLGTQGVYTNRKLVRSTRQVFTFDFHRLEESLGLRRRGAQTGKLGRPTLLKPSLKVEGDIGHSEKLRVVAPVS
jgi:hypothetical protein